MLKLLARLARELNWSRRSWSSASDERFHDDRYRDDRYDPFSWAYPGYTTIRRFADIVEPYLPPDGLVLDLGCGPGEITCELASRHPELSFAGIDHSAAGIMKAESNARRLGLRNICFERRRVEEFEPHAPADLVTLFDSFHHLTRPAEFVRRLAPHVKRWALIEPRGSWAGTWQKDIDVDWIAEDLEKIRAHVEGSVGSERFKEVQEGSIGFTEVQDGSAGTAVERRYTLDDFARFFPGYALDLRGTVAGLERYPPGWDQPGQLRERFGKLQWELYRDIDDWLYERNLDLCAKHWLIVAERGGKSRNVNVAALRADLKVGTTSVGAGVGASVGTDVGSGVRGQFDVRYSNYTGPLEAVAGERFFATVDLTNAGWDGWSSQDDVFSSYHWLDANGHVVDFDGERTPLPRPISAGETCTVMMNVRAPVRAGKHQLAIDLVKENVTWFSQAGHPWLVVPFTVR
jgi:SAM-dependent methyltransferase